MCIPNRVYKYSESLDFICFDLYMFTHIDLYRFAL